MQVTYCDICDTVLKEKKHIIVIFEDNVIKDDFTSARMAPKKDTFEICDSCLKVVKDIFKYKKLKSKELKEMVDKIYKIKTKAKHRKKKKGEQND